MSAMALPAPPTAEDRIRAALWFAERGFGVFSCWSAREDGTCRCPAGSACGSPGKHPVTAHGFADATRDPARIRTLLSAGSQPNYGLVCPEGVFAWDVDGEDVARLAVLEQRLGELPPTLRTDTAHGQHVFLRWPEALPSSAPPDVRLRDPLGLGAPGGLRHRPSLGPFVGRGLYARWRRRHRPTARCLGAGGAGRPGKAQAAGGGRPTPEEIHVGGRHDWLRDTARHYAGVVRDPDVLFAAIWTENQKLAEPKSEDAVRRAIGAVLERFGPDPVEEDPDTGAVRRVSDDEPGMLLPAAAGEFPAAARGDRLRGPPGRMRPVAGARH